jgi:hypothetical protein
MPQHNPTNPKLPTRQVQIALQNLEWPKGLPSPKALALKQAAAAAAGPLSRGSSGDAAALATLTSAQPLTTPRADSRAARPGSMNAFSRLSVLARGGRKGSGGGSDGGATEASSFMAKSEHRPPRSRPSASRLMGLLGPKGGVKARGLFNGLRVRMGVATGEMVRDSGYGRVVDMAKGGFGVACCETVGQLGVGFLVLSLLAVGHNARADTILPHCSVARPVVSDLANGGQIFTDAATFEGFKERLSELGAVTQNGLDGADESGARGCCSWARWGAFVPCCF